MFAQEHREGGDDAAARDRSHKEMRRKRSRSLYNERMRRLNDLKLIDATNEAKQLRDRLNELFENRDRYTWRETLESFKVVMIRMSEMRSRIANSSFRYNLVSPHDCPPTRGHIPRYLETGLHQEMVADMERLARELDKSGPSLDTQARQDSLNRTIDSLHLALTTNTSSDSQSTAADEDGRMAKRLKQENPMARQESENDTAKSMTRATAAALGKSLFAIAEQGRTQNASHARRR